MDAFSLHIIIYTIDSLIRAHFKGCDWIAMSMLIVGNSSSFSGFLCSPSFYFASLHCNYLFNKAPRTTGVEYTSNTDTILFYIGANNSSKNFAITNIQEIICRVFVPVESIIPCWYYKNGLFLYLILLNCFVNLK